MLSRILTILTLAIGASAAQAAAPTDPRVAAVTKLYHDYAWEVLITEPCQCSGHFISEPESVLSKYLAPKLVQLILADRACAARTREICNLDFSPIWAGNDPAAADLRVKLGTKPNEVLVQFNYALNDKKPILIYYDMIQVGGAWRIADIRTSEWSLTKILETPQ